MPAHAGKNSPRGLLGSGVFSPELLLDHYSSLLPFFFFFPPFCPLLSVGRVPSLPEQQLHEQPCSGHGTNPANCARATPWELHGLLWSDP